MLKKTNNGGKENCAPCRRSRLVVNHIVIYDFCGSTAGVVHSNNPLHLVFCFALFGYALTLCHPFCEPNKHILMLVLVKASEAAIQTAA